MTLFQVSSLMGNKGGGSRPWIIAKSIAHPYRLAKQAVHTLPSRWAQPPARIVALKHHANIPGSSLYHECILSFAGDRQHGQWVRVEARVKRKGSIWGVLARRAVYISLYRRQALLGSIVFAMLH